MKGWPPESNKKGPGFGHSVGKGSNPFSTMKPSDPRPGVEKSKDTSSGPYKSTAASDDFRFPGLWLNKDTYPKRTGTPQPRGEPIPGEDKEDQGSGES